MNSELLEQTHGKLRSDALDIFRAGLAAVRPEAAIRKYVRRDGDNLHIGKSRYALNSGRVFVIAFGKAASTMAQTLEEILGANLTAGIAVTKYGHAAGFHSEKITLFEAGHPLPDENGVQAAQQIRQVAKQAKANDLVLVAISGGGSALLSLPAKGLTLEDKQATTDLLLKNGADIREINTIRKHLSAVKGGRLAEAIFPAQYCSLILSDVIGDPLDFIASGPTVPDSTTFDDAFAICRKYALWEKLPARVRSYLEHGLKKAIPETPKHGNPFFAHGAAFLIGNNKQCADAALKQAKKMHYNGMVLTTGLQGEAREIAHLFPAIARDILNHKIPVAPPACIVCGGETTVTVKGSGKGGRNQEFVLAAAPGLSGLPGAVLLSAGTDGTDGATDAAGAIADAETLARAKKLNLDWQKYLANNDAYHFFQQTNDLIITGPTHTNVMDLQILLVAGSRVNR
ncbi:MAG: glycerate kinase [bacterium]